TVESLHTFAVLSSGSEISGSSPVSASHADGTGALHQVIGALKVGIEVWLLLQPLPVGSRHRLQPRLRLPSGGLQTADVGDRMTGITDAVAAGNLGRQLALGDTQQDAGEVHHGMGPAAGDVVGARRQAGQRGRPRAAANRAWRIPDPVLQDIDPSRLRVDIAVLATAIFALAVNRRR